MRRAALTSLVLAVACQRAAGTKAVAAPDTAWAPTVAVRPTDVLGWLALAPSTASDDNLPYWVPVDGATVLLPEIDPAVSPGTPFLAVPADGEPVRVTYSGRGEIAFGCDRLPLAVARFDGPRRLTPGLVWLLPMEPPPGWKPAGVAAQSSVATVEKRGWSAGPLAVTIARRDATHAAVEIAAAGRTVWRDEAEKHYMEGAEPSAIDLTLPAEIGMPMLGGVFRVADGGPALVAFAASGYESVRLYAVLVDGERGTLLEDRLRDISLYYCAF